MPPKHKLRTAAEVISRLRWSGGQYIQSDENCHVVGIWIGYDDRINGPMEKSLQEYVGVGQGGDIPEHRIQYFRREVTTSLSDAVLWDRAGRVDRLFGSGNGAGAAVAPETLERITQAVRTMERLELERNERRIEKAKQKARRRRQASTMLEHSPGSTKKGFSATNPIRTNTRYRFETTKCFQFSNEERIWRERAMPAGSESSPKGEPRNRTTLKAVTWNVLFDIYKDDVLGVIYEATTEENSVGRWTELLAYLSQTDADIISLQEVTPGFACLLLAQPWVQSAYTANLGPEDLTSVDPFGNMTIWKHSAFDAISSEICLDGNRQRGNVLALRHRNENSVLFCANIHLPADQRRGKDSKELDKSSRSFARRRELAAFVGHMQCMEHKMPRKNKMNVHLSHMLMGDFNTTEEDSLDDGSFSGSAVSQEAGHAGAFVDSWPLVAGKDPGFTYDPERNPRAQRAGSSIIRRRIDRIYIARNAALPGSRQGIPLEPLSAELLGSTTGIPPSDHFGLCVEFRRDPNVVSLLCSQEQAGCNSWAWNAFPTTDTLLALVLDKSSPLGKIKALDVDSSSLPVPHLTLLHGFVELFSGESLRLATKAVEDCVRIALLESKSPIQFLPFTSQSLSVFEHRNSASLVAIPDFRSKEGEWLLRLYNVLRATFRKCHEQESRFAEGWTPHMSVATHGTAQAARTHLSSLTTSGNWVDGTQMVPFHSAAIYRRSSIDGKFYCVSSIPLARARKKGALGCDPKCFLQDAGASFSSFMQGIALPILFDIERACQYEVDAISDGLLEAQIQTYGSHAMGASIHGISDVDAVVRISPRPGAAGTSNHTVSMLSNTSRFFNDFRVRLHTLFPEARSRVRVAGAGGVALHLLTIKTWPTAPSLDLLLCAVDTAANPIDGKSAAAREATTEHDRIVSFLLEPVSPTSLDMVQVFEGALRLIKIWATRRQVYGPSTGYLGGGGWSVFLARVLHDGISDGDIEFEEGESLGAASSRVAKFFFQVASELSCHPLTVIIPAERGAPEEVQTRREATRLAAFRSTAVVWAGTGNYARTSTKSTVRSTMKELQRAASLLECGGGLEEVFQPIRFPEFLRIRVFVLCLRVAVPGATQVGVPIVAETKAWAAIQFLKIIVALEEELGDASLIRPLAAPERAEESFCFLAGLDAAPRSPEKFLEERRRELEDNASASGLIAGSGARVVFGHADAFSDQFAAKVNRDSSLK